MDMVFASLAFIDGLGAGEIGLILIVVLVFFGGNKLPEFARGLGKTLRDFKKAAAGVEEEFKRALDEDERKQNQLKIAESPATPTPDPAPAPYDPAGPDTTSDHYDHDYHSGENPTDEATPAPEPTTPAADPVAMAEAGPAAPPVAGENTILAPTIPADPAPPPTPEPAVTPAGTPAPAVTPAAHPAPAVGHPAHP